MDYLRTLLFGLIHSEKRDSNNYRIAMYLLENFSTITKLSNTSLAKACNVSKSSITRFCKDLGLEDLIDLQILYRGSQKDDFNAKYNLSYQEYLPKLKESMDTFNIDEKVVEELVEQIEQKHCYCFGAMNSTNPAFALAYDLSNFDQIVEVICNIEDQKNILSTATKDDLIIIFSSSDKLLTHLDSRQKLKVDATIYVVCNNKSNINYSYVKKYIVLDHQYSYATSMINMMIFVNMVVLKYKEKRKIKYEGV